MTIGQKFIAKQYPEITYTVGKEKLKEFLIATKGDLEKFMDIVPPTFPVVYQHELLAAVLFDSELRLNLAKLVHGEQEFVYYKTVQVGDTIKTQGRIEKIFQKGPHDFVVFVTTSFNQVGEKVCDSIWTFVLRGGNDKDFTLQEKLLVKLASLLPESPKEKNLKQKLFNSLSQKTDKKVTINQAKQDLFYYEKLSDKESRMTVWIDKYMPQVYAGASGDFNIIHLDSEFGRSVGLGTNILHGMATMALGANFALVGVDPRKLKRYKARFSNPVKPLDVLTYTGKWSDSGKEFSFKASKQFGVDVLVTATLELQ